jgi:hypothetical protein
MDHVKHLREQAERCFGLAQDVTNQESRTQLEMFGREYAERADNIERGQTAVDGAERPSKHAPDEQQ